MASFRSRFSQPKIMAKVYKVVFLPLPILTLAFKTSLAFSQNNSATITCRYYTSNIKVLNGCVSCITVLTSNQWRKCVGSWHLPLHYLLLRSRYEWRRLRSSSDKRLRKLYELVLLPFSVLTCVVMVLLVFSPDGTVFSKDSQTCISSCHSPLQYLLLWWWCAMSFSPAQLYLLQCVFLKVADLLLFICCFFWCVVFGVYLVYSMGLRFTRSHAPPLLHILHIPYDPLGSMCGP